MSDDMEWGEPPKQDWGSKPGRTMLFVEGLKKRPGEWAKYPKTIRGGLTMYRKGHPGVEWTSRRVGRGESAVYARWVGER